MCWHYTQKIKKKKTTTTKYLARSHPSSDLIWSVGLMLLFLQFVGVDVCCVCVCGVLCIFLQYFIFLWWCWWCCRLWQMDTFCSNAQFEMSNNASHSFSLCVYSFWFCSIFHHLFRSIKFLLYQFYQIHHILLYCHQLYYKEEKQQKPKKKKTHMPNVQVSQYFCMVIINFQMWIKLSGGKYTNRIIINGNIFKWVCDLSTQITFLKREKNRPIRVLRSQM